MDILVRPYVEQFGEEQLLINLRPTDAFFITIKFGILAGFILVFPIIVYHIWSFLSPALKKAEKRVIVPSLYLGLVLFLLGVLMAYYIALPITLEFLTGFQTAIMMPAYTAQYYFGFTIQLLVAFGVIFELPVVVMILSVLGLVTPKFLRNKRRHAILLITIVAALISPGDVIMLTVLMMVPLIILYEFSILPLGHDLPEAGGENLRRGRSAAGLRSGGIGHDPRSLPGGSSAPSQPGAGPVPPTSAPGGRPAPPACGGAPAPPGTRPAGPGPDCPAGIARHDRGRGLRPGTGSPTARAPRYPAAPGLASGTSRLDRTAGPAGRPGSRLRAQHPALASGIPGQPVRGNRARVRFGRRGGPPRHIGCARAILPGRRRAHAAGGRFLHHHGRLHGPDLDGGPLGVHRARGRATQQHFHDLQPRQPARHRLQRAHPVRGVRQPLDRKRRTCPR